MFGSYLNRCPSSKSISTSTTLRQRSPSIKLQQPGSPRPCFSSVPHSFIDQNLGCLNTFKQLLQNQEGMVEYHKRWCSQMKKRVETVFGSVSTQITALLSEQEYKVKQDIQNEFITFLNFLKNVKNQINNIYRTKQHLHSEQIVTLQNKFSNTNQYYTTQHFSPRSHYDLENQQRYNLQNHNRFYKGHQQYLNELGQKVGEQLNIEEKLRQKKQYLENALSKFSDNFEGYCAQARQSWQEWW